MKSDRGENLLRNISDKEWEGTGAKPKRSSQKIYLNDFLDSDETDEKPMKIEVKQLVDNLNEEQVLQTAIKKPTNYEFPRPKEATINKSPSTEESNGQGEPVAASQSENRNYLTVNLSGHSFKALYDTGATISLIGPRGIELFKDRLKNDGTVLRSITGETQKTRGNLSVLMEVDGKVKNLDLRASENIDHEMVLGMDFVHTWKIEEKGWDNKWRVANGKWHSFASEENDKLRIRAECAGICEITSDQEDQVKALIRKYLKKCTEKHGYTTLIKHAIDVQGAPPFKHSPRRMSPKIQEVAQEEVRKMLQEKVIEPSCSEWCSSPVIVKKRDGTYRFCIDYLDLNKVTKKDAYPMRNIDAILDKLRKAKYLTKIDLKSAYF